MVAGAAAYRPADVHTGTAASLVVAERAVYRAAGVSAGIVGWAMVARGRGLPGGRGHRWQRGLADRYVRDCDGVAGYQGAAAGAGHEDVSAAG